MFPLYWYYLRAITFPFPSVHSIMIVISIKNLLKYGIITITFPFPSVHKIMLVKSIKDLRKNWFANRKKLEQGFISLVWSKPGIKSINY